MRLVEVPGHTPGHAGYLLTAGEQRLLAFGDALHSPLQIAQPEWGAASDARPELALKSRERVLSELRVPRTIFRASLGRGLAFDQRGWRGSLPAAACEPGRGRSRPRRSFDALG